MNDSSLSSSLSYVLEESSDDAPILDYVLDK